MATSKTHLFQPTTLLSLRFYPIIIALSAIPQMTSGALYIGQFPSLAHRFQGKVFILNDRQFRIQDFTYDGLGHAVWFMGMVKGSEGIYSADGIVLPNHMGSCERYDAEYENDDITITLPWPLRVYDLEALALYCFQCCQNIGHVYIPDGIQAYVPAAPNYLPELGTCDLEYKLCNNLGRHV